MTVSVCVVLALLAWVAGPGEDPVAVAEEAAKSAAAEPGGKAFGEAVGQAFGRDHAVTIQRCAKETKRAELSDFAVLLRSDGSGVVDQAYVKPATNLAVCVRAKLTGWKGPSPPRAGFWTNVAVSLKKK